MTAVPLVLLNAFPLDKEQWEPLLEQLAAVDAPLGDIITFDPPGIGDMPATEEPPSLELIADAAVTAMREVTGRADALWVGCSMGGYVALAVLERHPDAVAGIGLIDTRAGADSDQAAAGRVDAAKAAEQHDGLADPAATARGLLGASGASSPELLAWATANAARQRGRGIAWGQLAMRDRPARIEVLRASQVPGFVVWGEEDAVAPLAEAESMADALGVAAVLLPGVGHLAAAQEPRRIAELIAELALAAR